MFPAGMWERSNPFWEFEVNSMSKNMKKILLRGLLGIPLGITIEHLIALVISLSLADGRFHAVTPYLAQQCGSEAMAVLWSTVGCALLGAVSAGSSVIFEMERWSILRQTVTHLVVLGGAYFTAAFTLGWYEPNLKQILFSLLIFCSTYVGIWLAQYWGYLKKIRQINEKLES